MAPCLAVEEGPTHLQMWIQNRQQNHLATPIHQKTILTAKDCKPLSMFCMANWILEMAKLGCWRFPQHIIIGLNLFVCNHNDFSQSFAITHNYSCAITMISVGRGERFQIPEVLRVSNLKFISSVKPEIYFQCQTWNLFVFSSVKPKEKLWLNKSSFLFIFKCNL